MANDIDDIIESVQSQCDAIIEYCKVHGYITAKEAMEVLGVFRLAARIDDLEGKGFVFEHEMFYYKDRHGRTKRFMKYRLMDRSAA